MIKRLFGSQAKTALAGCAAVAVCAAVLTTAKLADPRKPDSAGATIIQLIKTEGDVAVFDANGSTLPVIENMKLYNGYQTTAQASSYAWMSLDSQKLTKLDAVSEAEIRKNGRKLEILLKSGSLFFNVTEPLEEDETLNIRTSTMVMGIRGTSGWVKIIDRWHSQVGLLEGTVICYVSDPVTGQMKYTTLSAGEMAEFVVYGDDRNGERCDIIKRKITEEDISGYILMELAGDSSLIERIRTVSGANAVTAGSAGRRLAGDEERLNAILADMEERYAAQENHISKDPVWVRGARIRLAKRRWYHRFFREEDDLPEEGGDSPEDGPVTPGGNDEGQAGQTPSEDRRPSGGGSPSDSRSPGGEDRPEKRNPGQSRPEKNTPAEETTSPEETKPPEETTSPGETTPPEETTPPSENENPGTARPAALTVGVDDTTVDNIQRLLNDPEVSEVVVKPDPANVPGGEIGPLPSKVVVGTGDKLTIPDGKKLTMDRYTDLDVDPGGEIVVEKDGTLEIGAGGRLNNEGSVTVDGPRS